MINSKGFSLVGVMMGVAGAGALTLAILQIAQLSSSINAMGNESLELQNNLYIGKVLLSDQNTCRLNFGGTAFAGTKIKVDKVLKQKSAAGTSLGTAGIFPTTGINDVNSLYLRPVEGAANVVWLDVVFDRSPALGKNQTVLRSIPLQIALAAGKIVNCTAAELPLNPSKEEDDGGGKGGDDSPAPKLADTAVFGNCDKSPPPLNYNIFGDMNHPSYISSGREDFCDKTKFPIDSHGTVNCKGLETAAFSFLSRYGAHCSSSTSGLVPLFRFGSGNTSLSETVQSSRLAGIQSKADCMKLPMHPAGTQLKAVNGTGVHLSCINGSWQGANPPR